MTAMGVKPSTVARHLTDAELRANIAALAPVVKSDQAYLAAYRREVKRRARAPVCGVLSAGHGEAEPCTLKKGHVDDHSFPNKWNDM